MSKRKIFNVLFTAVLGFIMLGSSAYALEDESIHNTATDQHKTCIRFVNDYNGSVVRESCASQGVSGTKTYTHKETTFSNQGTVYTIDGWYDEAGNKVSDGAKVSVQYKASDEKCEILIYYLRWNALKAPILHFNYTDHVSTGTGSWSNTDGTTADNTHTFRQPEDQAHYKFLYWLMGETKYYDGDSFTYSFKDKEYNTEETINAYAWWQSSVTLNLYDGDSLLKSTEDFEKVSIDIEPSKPAYDFIGWLDEEGNEVTDDTFYPEPASDEKVTPKVVNLYANFKRILTDINIVKTWDDNNNARNLRPDSITVNLFADTILSGNYVITKDMDWKYLIAVNKFTEDGTEINYSITEDEVAGYNTVIDGFNIVNKIIPEPEVVTTSNNNVVVPPKTGVESSESLYATLITIMIGLLSVLNIKALRKLAIK